MKKTESPIPIYKLAFLQAYLYQILTLDKQCENNFNHTEWYLKEHFSAAEMKTILNFLDQQGLKCDCDLINKLNLKELLNNKLITHQ